jgi:apolipoprotein N-acyltransferase
MFRFNQYLLIMKNLKSRILTGWTFIRFAYLVMGSFITYQAFLQVQWIGGIFGLYFVSMAVFGFGCAGGACYTKPKYSRNDSQDNTAISSEANKEMVTFEEVTANITPTASK